MYSSSNAATSVDNAHADDKTKQAARLWRGRIKNDWLFQDCSCTERMSAYVKAFTPENFFF